VARVQAHTSASDYAAGGHMGCTRLVMKSPDLYALLVIWRIRKTRKEAQT